MRIVSHRKLKEFYEQELPENGGTNSQKPQIGKTYRILKMIFRQLTM